MLKNYLKITLRNLKRQPGFTAINLVGLAIGLACCMLVLLHVQDELSYDRHLANLDRLYRVNLDAKMGDQEIAAPLAPAPLAGLLVSELPEVEQAARIFRSSFASSKGVSVMRGTNGFIEERFFHVDSTLLDVFSFQVVAGSKKDALAAPNAIVLTEEMAEKYFGDDNPIGKTLRIDGQTDYQITAVVRDVPDQSHWHFDFLASLSSLPISKSTQWVSNPFSTYLLLKPGQDINAVESKLQKLLDENVAEQFQSVFGLSMEQFASSGGRYNFTLQPVADVHLYSNLEYEFEANGSMRYVYLFSAVALLILIIACFNFMNLATARSANRAKEVGIRKSLGSERKQLVVQFLFESILLCGLSLLIALVLVKITLPSYNAILGKSMEVSYFSSYFVPGAFVFVLILGVLAGAYPAFFLTSFNITAVLKGKLRTGAKNNWLRSSLVVLQFAISIALMIGTAVVFQQVSYIQNKRLGFDKDHLMVIERGGALGNRRETFKRELENLSGVVASAGLDNLPGHVLNDDSFKKVGEANDELQLTWIVRGDYDLAKTLGINIVNGRDFSREAPRDSSVLIMNNAAVAQLGITDLFGEQLSSPFANPGQPERIYRVVGVMEDVHFESLHQEIKPFALELATDSNPLSYLVVRLRPEQMSETLAAIEASWAQFVPGEPFEYSFLDQQLEELYRSDLQTGRLVGMFSGLAILIACLGLFGLAAFIAESRVKEIGIRKTLGATVAGIVGMFTADFLKLVAVAFVIASPIAFFAASSWLEAFAYRIEVSWLLILLIGGLAVFIAFATVAYQSIRAALINPVKALRYE